MPQGFRPSVVVAKSGPAGHRVYLTEADRWTADLTEAELIEDEAHGDIRLLEARHAGVAVSGVALAEVRFGPRGLEGLRSAVEAV